MASNATSDHGCIPRTADSANVDDIIHGASEELPFLVTRWLANYNELHPRQTRDRIQEDAVQRLHQAAAEVASAFSALGAFGSANRPSFGPSPSEVLSQGTGNATYGDLARRWSDVAPSHLETLVGSAVLATISAESAARQVAPPNNLMEAAHESKPNASHAGGRRLGDRKMQARIDEDAPAALSTLHIPSLLANEMNERSSKELCLTKPADSPVNSYRRLAVPIESDHKRIHAQSAKCMRNLLSLRERFRLEEEEIRSLCRSMAKQEESKEQVAKERSILLRAGNHLSDLVPRNPLVAESASLLGTLDEKEQNCDRVIAQLKRKLSELAGPHAQLSGELHLADAEARSIHRRSLFLLNHFRDPFETKRIPFLPVSLSSCRQRMLVDITSRQHGGNGSDIHHRIGRVPSLAAMNRNQKALISEKLSHSITVNAHLTFPVYCLRFDLTGRYFVTGADDCLVKLFCLGVAKSRNVGCTTDGGREVKVNYGANARSAILVCTLRGHAGVICDIAVSADNAFLATASDDGDCRIWGLKDGCPIAILRGHRGGANMISWSLLTPYQLVTTDGDGFARVWDIREAALKRYGAYIGNRPDYTLPLTKAERKAESENLLSPLTTENRQHSDTPTEPNLLPPLPLRDEHPQQGESDGMVNIRRTRDGADGPLRLRSGHPAPIEGQDAAVRRANVVRNNEQIVPGAFVSNDVLDEGVRLIAKLQHGDTVEIAGPGTRSRRKAVKVICVARCPIGGQFATGADDGICRVWSDEDDDRVSKIDRRYAKDDCGRASANRQTGRSPTRSAQSNSDVPLLASLLGHVNAVTDLQYSHSGDRLLTASQKDGAARVWSWTMDSDTNSTTPGRRKIADLKHIMLRLTMPNAGMPRPETSRRRGVVSNTTGAGVYCDVATWTPDDSKIVTSQCCLVKVTHPEIVPGSQYLFLWDSRNGQCLLGIAGAHKLQCPVLVPHPNDASLLCSAGSDGFVKIWDLESGQCVLSHENVVDFGPTPESNERGKHSGYLDGSFSPDGLTLVLTDDNGRFTVFAATVKDSNDVATWMREQYFANDYYELCYDTNGYCVERGSEQPPHLAPRAARCAYTGVSWAEDVNETFRNLVGPLPLSEEICRWRRERIRSRAGVAFSGNRTLPLFELKRAVVLSEFEWNRTILIGEPLNAIAEATRFQHRNAQSLLATSIMNNAGTNPLGSRRVGASSNRSLSTNYRWIGYEDLRDDDGAPDEDADSDDEEFVAPLPSSSPTHDEELSEGYVSDAARGLGGNVESQGTRRHTNARSRRRERRGREREHVTSHDERSRNQPTRVSARQLAGQRAPYVEPDSDDDVVEFVSTNNTPSGPHVNDYNVAGHFFRLPESGHVNRLWLRRIESRTSHNGIKNYAPQIGDSVVYISRAHYETIQRFPTLDAPWKLWRTGTKWPFVLCSIKDIRYRFPYEAYYRNRNQAGRCLSIVAILTLEVSGIPQVSQDREFPWPKPAFINRQAGASTQTFEVSMFESDCPEFIIPEKLFTWRLQCLEDAFRERNLSLSGLPVISYYLPEPSSSLGTVREDSEMEPYRGTVLRLLPSLDEEADDHLRGSGFGSVELSWESNETDAMSPWELTLQKFAYHAHDPPRLNAGEKLAVSNALQTVEQRPEVQQWFTYPVDEHRYSDYSNRIEISMDFSFIRERFAQDYYSSTHSVLADVRLIRDNCIKYNANGSDLSARATEIYNEFETELRRELEMNSSTPPRVILDDRNDTSPDDPATNTHFVVNSTFAGPLESARHLVRSTRLSMQLSRSDRLLQNTSSLESLPQPSGMGSPTARASRARRSTVRQSTSQQHVESKSSVRITRSNATHESSVGNVVENRTGDDDLEVQGHIRNSEDEDSDDHSEALEEQPESSSQRGSDDESSYGNEHQVSSRRPSNESRPRQGQRTSQCRAKKYLSDEESDGSYVSDHVEDEDVSDEELEATAPLRSSKRSVSMAAAEQASIPQQLRRKTRNSVTKDDDNKESQLPSKNKGEQYALRQRSSRRSQSTRQREQSPSSQPDDSIRQNRGRVSRHATKLNADIDEEVGESSQDEDFSGNDEGISHAVQRSSRRTISTRTKKQPRSVSTKQQSLPVAIDTVTSPRRRSTRAGRPKSMADVSHSEVDEDGSCSDNAAPIVRNETLKRRKVKGKSDSSRPSKRLKSRSKEHQVTLPEMKAWPKIDLKDITNVANGIVDEMINLDEEGNFVIPVAEAFPDISDSYLSVVEHPMDFRTIKEERIPVYQSIKELQDDLKLIFQNCALYNGPESPYSQYATALWGLTNDVFRNVCKELNSLFPRTWEL